MKCTMKKQEIIETIVDTFNAIHKEMNEMRSIDYLPQYLKDRKDGEYTAMLRLLARVKIYDE